MTETLNFDISSLHKSERPHLRLFLSADIVGSTAFKQNSKSSSAIPFPPWFTVVLQFYQQAEQSLATHWETVVAQTSKAPINTCGDAPELWKTIGDEVLFTKRIDHPAQANICLHVWIATLNEIRYKLREFGLDVKSTAWLADFPLRNNEIVLYRKTGKVLEDTDQIYIKNNQENLVKYYENQTSSSDFLRDFIGPSIDTGFRLGAFSSVRKLALSVELAYVLGAEQVRADEDKKIYSNGVYVLPKFDFKYEGRHTLKGVLSGTPYPIIWLDLDPDNPVFRAEDKVINSPRPSGLEIRELAGAFIKSQEPNLSIPHVAGCEFKEYEALSASQIDLLQQRQVVIQKLKDTVAMEQEMSEKVAPDNADPIFVDISKTGAKTAGEASDTPKSITPGAGDKA